MNEPQRTSTTARQPAKTAAGPGATTTADAPGGAVVDPPPRSHRTPPRVEARRLLRKVTDPDVTHPALLPGVGVEQTGKDFSTHRVVLGVAAAFVVAFVVWGVVGPDSLTSVSSAALTWVSDSLGWLFSLLTVVVLAFMLWVGFGRYGSIRLGRDDERPEYSRFSWIAMLFAAGMGIGLLFYGPYEPLTYMLDLPPAFSGIAPGSEEAMRAAMAQTLFHWGPMAWSYYALVGGAVAYAAYRKGRNPLMSALLEPIFGARTKGWLGSVVDVLAILVTLFGTAVSLGIGALQIARGVEIVGGIGPVGNGVVVGIIAVLGAAFITSAVSGVKRGVRALSNINMVMTGLLGVFVFLVGPTAFILTFVPSSVATFIGDLPALISQSAVTSGSPDPGSDEAAREFMRTWTTYYWAWWVSWTPFVGLFIAKISRGRTLREFVTTVIIAPSVVCLLWFGVVGGTTMRLEHQGSLAASATPQDKLFALLDALPLGAVTAVVAMIAIVIFFVTSADSASIVMASMSQRGRPEPSRGVTIGWGVALAVIAAVLLVGGGQQALDGLQALVIVAAVPFVVVLVLIMASWAKDLARDPQVLRRRYAVEAIRIGVTQGIEEHGDDFRVAVAHTEPHERSAGDWLDTDDPALTQWYDERQDEEEGPPSDASDGGPVPVVEVVAGDADEVVVEVDARPDGPAGTGTVSATGRAG